MSSWFSNFNASASDALGTFNASDFASDAFDKLKEVSSQVQQALPIDEDLINKLTLRSADLKAEHDLIDAQETRKELVRNYLSHLLPWETKDEAREILVEECHDAITAMSKEETTFTGPFELPEGTEGVERIRMFTESAELSEATEESRAEAAKKLEKMGTLPPLLDEFDIDAHVGLIERLFKEDQDLVRMHSLLESAGKTEKIFWKNYFFHCAFIRYEKGLSVEEIWSVHEHGQQSDPSSSAKAGHGSVAGSVASLHGHSNADDEDSVELTFEPDDGDDYHPEEEDDGGVVDAPETDSSDFELVDRASDNALDDEELDELEAEIARELEEIDGM